MDQQTIAMCGGRTANDQSALRLQRPDKNSRTSSKPPSTDKKEKRENSRPGGATLGHEPHNRRLADNPDEFCDHIPSGCEQCGGSFRYRGVARNHCHLQFVAMAMNMKRARVLLGAA
jgi:hypothetical protein